MAFRFKSRLIVFVFATMGCAAPCLGQTPQQTPAPPGPEQRTPGGIGGQPLPDQQLSGSISGTVVDQSGAVVAGARVRVVREDQSPGQESQSGDDGQFFFANVPAGPFHLTITAAGFATQTFSGSLEPGQIETVPQIALEVATTVTEVQVELTQTEVAEEEIKIEEKQRVLGVIPNFYVTYDPNPVPLTSRQKFELAWKMTVNPFTFGIIGAIAGVEQALNDFSGYGQGAQGYGKRYGAAYADTVAGTFIGAALLPSLLKQDPRYFYKGSGSKRSRALYAIANAVICKGDNGRWQPNYSNVLGSLAAGGLSNLYYPADDREGAGLTFENAGIGIGATAIANLFQEFVVRKFTPKHSSHDPAKP